MPYDKNGYPDVPELDQRVYDVIRAGQCIPFFGAGSSMEYSFNGAFAPGIPSACELTMTLLREAGVAMAHQIAVLQNPAQVLDPDELRDAMKLAS
jgi:hypothetical protein